MSEVNDGPDVGGSAFPTNNSNYESTWSDPGMTLRDYFAGRALSGLLAGGTLCGSAYARHETDCDTNSEEFAVIAYRMADAMLEARKE